MTPSSIDNRLIATEIEERLRETKTFIDHVVLDDIYAGNVSLYKTINVPQTGALPEVAIDDSSELSVQTTRDTHTTYKMHSYRTKPILIRNYEDYLTSLEKQQNITQEQATQLKNAFCKHSMHKLATQVVLSSTRNKRQLLTTGSARTSSQGTGNRKSLSFSDLLAIRKQLIKDSGGQGTGRYIGVLNAEMYADMLQLNEVKRSHLDLSNSSTAGAVSDFMDFTFFLREDLPVFASGSKSSGMTSFSSSSVPNAASAAALFFNADLIRRAISPEVSVYLDVSATHGGAGLSSEVYGGVSLARTDSRGMVLLLEGAA